MSAPHYEQDPLRVAEAAAEAALERDARVRKQRLKDITVSALAAFIAACAVCIPVVLIQSSDNEHTSHRAAVTNCSTQASARPQGNARGFALAELLTLGERIYNSFPPRFKAAELAHINADARAQAAYFPGQFPEVKLESGKRVPQLTDFSDLTAVIEPLPLLNCRRLPG